MSRRVEVLEEFEETALIGAKKVREFLLSENATKDALHKAKAGAVAMGSYARLRATMANEVFLKLQAKKMATNGRDADLRQLPEAV